VSHSPQPISYRSGPAAARPAAPSEFDHAYEQERGRWLRRRFLFYTGVSLGFGLLITIPTLIFLFSKESPGNVAFQTIVLLISNLVYAAALVVAWRSRPVYGRILRVALATYLFASLLSVGFTHLYYMVSADTFQADLLQGFRVGVADVETDRAKRSKTTRPATAATTLPSTNAFVRNETELFGGRVRHSYIAPAVTRIGSMPTTFTMPWALDNVMYWIVWTTLLFSITFNHLFISLFLPWTVRESLRPAVAIGAAFVFMVAVDTGVGVAWWPTALVALVLLPFSFVPGTVVCWWRYSRFNKQFKQRFESQGFKKLQDELIGARRIHESNLPTPITDGPIRVAFDYEPMREIGGDLLMLHRSRGGDAVTAVLFDVTGHGVSAALSVNRIVGEIERTFAMDTDASPELLICNLNKYIHAILSKHQIYATAIVVRIDAKAGTLEYVNAGHPPALLLRQFGNATRLDPNAMMLGVCDAIDFPCEMTTHELTEFESVVLYTDGASEAIDPHDQMLGIEGTLDAIAQVASERGDPDSWPAAIHDRVVAHRQSPPTDDTLIVTMWRA
jgi:serine phosphatase RsbU (regulator of sigma subunit)